MAGPVAKYANLLGHASTPTVSPYDLNIAALTLTIYQIGTVNACKVEARGQDKDESNSRKKEVQVVNKKM